jgi:hypothetical protein
MPAKHRYRCLNPNCPSLTSKTASLTFVTMNSPQPTCPRCASIKLEDWGVATNVMVGVDGGGKQSDANLRRIADRYGLTDMSNKDGRAVKSAAPAAKGELGSITLPGGVQAPVDYTPKCSHIPMSSTPLKLEAGARFSGRARHSVPTNVVAEHKGVA